MKNFLISFLGALAGIWFSLFLAVIGIFIVIAAAMASSGGNTTVNVSNNSVLCVSQEPSMTVPRKSTSGKQSAVEDLKKTPRCSPTSPEQSPQQPPMTALKA